MVFSMVLFNSFLMYVFIIIILLLTITLSLENFWHLTCFVYILVSLFVLHSAYIFHLTCCSLHFWDITYYLLCFICHSHNNSRSAHRVQEQAECLSLHAKVKSYSNPSTPPEEVMYYMKRYNKHKRMILFLKI
jgi:hypothetical protein